jgi:hypothetical protein
MLLLAASGNRGYGFETSIVGLSLLFVLFGYDEESDRPMMQSLAFAAVAGLCGMAALIYPIILMMAPKSPEQWAASLWLAATLLFFAVDRMRASSRESSAMSLASAQGARAAAYTPPATVYTPPVPVYAPPAPTYTPPVPVYTPPAPVYNSPAPVYTPQPEPVAVTQPVYEAAAPEPSYAPPPPVQQPTHPVQQPVAVSIAPIPQGREAIIFLNLMGEGLNVLRSVKAEHLGRDYYRIAEPKPDNERWEYEPNSVVRCRKKALSNGKQLVAFEEAPRAQ